MDKRSFAIIIILTTVVSYLFIRRYFKIAPRYFLYASVGIFLGLLAGITIAWPMSAFLGNFGIIVAPYILGMILMVFIEFFILEGGPIMKLAVKEWGIFRRKSKISVWGGHRVEIK